MLSEAKHLVAVRSNRLCPIYSILQQSLLGNYASHISRNAIFFLVEDIVQLYCFASIFIVTLLV
jgi:hypothetical protein